MNRRTKDPADYLPFQIRQVALYIIILCGYKNLQLIISGNNRILFIEKVYQARNDHFGFQRVYKKPCQIPSFVEHFI